MIGLENQDTLVLAGLCGSLRKGSLHAHLLGAAGASVSAPWTYQAISIIDIPLYNQDIEDEGIPDAVTAVKRGLAAADAILIATPEYNSGIPGVLKNAIDWASRPQADIARVFAGKPVAVIGATPGPWGTLLMQDQMQTLFRILRMVPWHAKRFMLPSAHSACDADGRLDEEVARRLDAFVADFLDFAGRLRVAA